MTKLKSIETPDHKVWIEQHNDIFVLKYQERNKSIQALNGTTNLTLVLEFFDKLVGKFSLNN